MSMDLSSLGYAGIAGSGLAAIGNLGASYLNFGLQREQFDYQKALQERIFAREDTALQRRMADAAAAGLNPYSVINSGGANAGSVVKTEAPQLNANFNGVLDTINNLLDIETRKAQTERAVEDAKNAQKEGLYLDSKITGQAWQNIILGNQDRLYQYDIADRLLDSLRNQAYFNYDFGTDIHYLTDEEGRFTTKLYDTHSNRPKYFGVIGEYPWYAREWYNDNNIMHSNRMLQQSSNLQDMWYTNYASEEANWEHDVLKFQRDLAEKENNWYNWNQGFNMLDRVFDDVTGILFKNLDLGIQRENSASTNKLHNAQASYYNRRR